MATQCRRGEEGRRKEQARNSPVHTHTRTTPATMRRTGWDETTMRGKSLKKSQVRWALPRSGVAVWTLERALLVAASSLAHRHRHRLQPVGGFPDSEGPVYEDPAPDLPPIHPRFTLPDREIETTSNFAGFGRTPSTNERTNPLLI